MRTIVMLLGWVAVALRGTPAAAASYQPAAVADGGTITGQVRLAGTPPELRYFPLVLYPFGTFCKKIADPNGNVVLQEFLAGDAGGLQDTIVAVEGVAAGKPFTPITAEWVAVDCMFHPADVAPEQHTARDQAGRLFHEHPLVTAMQNDQPLQVWNQDPILHNGQVFQSERGNIVLNFPLPVSTQPAGGVVHLAPGKRIVQMICGMHEFMQAWGFVVDNPYYAKTGKGGGFSIDQLPPGTYKVTAWHPHLQPIVQEVTVRPNETVALDFEFDAAQVRRPIFETQEKFRVGPATHSHAGAMDDGPEHLIVK